MSESTTAETEYARQMDQWRSYLARREGITEDDAAELEDHLDSLVADLTAVGLSRDEAFVVAIKRLGAQSILAADFARENSQELWKHFVLDDATPSTPAARRRDGVWPMLGFAVAAALVVLIGIAPWSTPAPDASENFRLPFMALGVAGVLAAYFFWRDRRLDRSAIAAVSAALVAIGCAAAFYPFAAGYVDTFLLLVLHLPVLLAVLLGIPYLGERWRDSTAWMDYIRFVGEWLVYYALIALGGGVLIGLSMGIFLAFGIDAEGAFMGWVVPAGIGGALVVTAWLVHLKRSVVENMAPVLTMVFTPLFTLVLLVLLVTVTVTGNALGQDRDLLVIVDLLLVVVWGLVLFGVSARPQGDRPRAFDWLQVVLIAATLAVDLLALAAIGTRISEWGFTPNRVAALGENLVIAVNLAWSLWLSIGFLRRRRDIEALAAWQSRYLPVVGIWAAIVVFVFPPLFNFR